jgi:outer membrane immunogenic protein
LFAFGALVYAGPEPLPSGKEMKQVAPAPPPCPNWTGFYIGAFGGYKFAATDINLDLFGDWNGPSPSDPFDKEFIEPRAPHDLDASGAEAGGLIGYNYQWNKWVFGLEASGGYLWLRNSDNTGTFTVPATGDIYNVSTSFKTHYLVTVGPRIGYAFCRWLPYVTGGLAIGDIDFDQEITQFFRGRVFFDEGGSTSETKVGWMVGGGLEYALTDHWHLRGQYQYIDLGCTDFHSIGSASFNIGYFGHHEACLREHNASVAIIFEF